MKHHRATFRMPEPCVYSAVIPMIQNVYAPLPEEHKGCGWYWGFKFSSGIFEYFNLPTREEACREHERLLVAIDEYWCAKQGDNDDKE